MRATLIPPRLPPIRLARQLGTACLLSAVAWYAHAAIAPGDSSGGAAYSRNGNLFLSVFGSDVSYTMDMGVTLNDFFVSAQQNHGAHLFWEVGDANWKSFVSQVNPSQLRWAVLGFDTVGGRLLTTAKQGDEAKISGFGNQAFQSGISASGSFLNAVNVTGTHGRRGQPADYFVNGSSVNRMSSGNAYFGNAVGLSPTLNGNAPFDDSNQVGQSSWFYGLSRSGAGPNGAVLIDEFDNAAADGYFGLVKVDALLYPTSPYAGEYLLSYTLAAAEVPEPGTWSLMWVGGFVLLGSAARRRMR